MKDREIIGLGIESSCDETGVAVVRNGRDLLSNVVYSQIPEHAPFRGVVPEIASRSHLEKMGPVYRKSIRESGVDPEKIDYVAVTTRPGLLGSLMMGGIFAKSFSLVHGVPVIAVDHLEAHLQAVRLEGVHVPYPFLGLLLSGGNSAIYRVDGPGSLTCLVDTTDDALGEAFDKASSVMDLDYPGGPVVESTASRCRGECQENSLFPLLLKSGPEREPRFSFSGIKTAVIRAVREGHPVEKICHDFQNTVFELVERLLLRMVRESGIDTVVAAGGVMANGTLKKRLESLAGKNHFRIHSPSPGLCTDNAAMVAAAGFPLFERGETVELDFSVSSRRS